MNYLGPDCQTFGVSSAIVIAAFGYILLTNGLSDPGIALNLYGGLTHNAESVPAMITTLTISKAASQ